MSTKRCGIGIDFGSSRFMIAMASRGSISILFNDDSTRQTPCVVSFGSQRCVGDRALAQATDNLKNTIFYPGRFLGDLTPRIVQHEQPFCFARVRLRDECRAQFQVAFEGAQIAIAPEQAVGALFTEVVDILELNEIEDREAVISVPSYFNQMQRQAVINAAGVAGIKVGKLLNESSAVILNHSSLYQDELSADRPQLVAFVDFGHSKTAIYVANIWKNRAEMLIEETNAYLGVRDMDQALLLFYIQKIKQKFKVDLTDNPGARYRLLEAIEGQRKALTTRAEAAITVEALIEGVNFTYSLQREEFEQVTARVLTDLQEVIDRVTNWLQRSKLGLNLINVERVGGGTRIPCVLTIIQRSFRTKLFNKMVDTNQFVARGCAILAANSCSIFKIPAFAITDKISHPFILKFEYAGHPVVSQKIFDRGSQVGQTFVFSITKPLRLSLGVFIAQNSENAPERQILHSVIESTIPKGPEFEATAIFRLDQNGLVALERVEMQELFVSQKTIFLRKTITISTKTSSVVQNRARVDLSWENSLNAGDLAEAEADCVLTGKEKLRTRVLPHQSSLLYGLSNEQLKSMRHFEDVIAQKENIVKEARRAKHRFESFIYDTRNKINDPSNARLIIAQEKHEVLRSLQEGENWLFTDGAKCTRLTYEQRLGKLQAICKKFYLRFHKMEEMTFFYDQAIAAFKECGNYKEEIAAHGTMAQVGEFEQKFAVSLGLLKELRALLSNPSIEQLEKVEFESHKFTLGSSFETIQIILHAVRCQRENLQREDGNWQSQVQRSSISAKLDVSQSFSTIKQEKRR